MARRSQIVQASGTATNVAVPRPEVEGGQLFCSAVPAGELEPQASGEYGSILHSAQSLAHIYLSATVWGVAVDGPTGFTISTDTSFPVWLTTEEFTCDTEVSMDTFSIDYNIVGEGSFVVQAQMLDVGTVPLVWAPIAEITVDLQTGDGHVDSGATVDVPAGRKFRFCYVPGAFTTGPSGPSAHTAWLKCVAHFTNENPDELLEWL